MNARSEDKRSDLHRWVTDCESDDVLGRMLNESCRIAAQPLHEMLFEVVRRLRR